jgi:hypothetical protein
MFKIQYDQPAEKQNIKV